MTRLSPSDVKRRPPRPGGRFADSPMVVFYEVTQACDLVCEHCRACAQTEARPGELTAEQSLRLIDQIAEFPTPPMLVLTGGDPFKRADIFQLIHYATSSALKVSITPSATPLVTARAIRRLRTGGITRMAVSIDGADATTHDAFRGVAGSFDRTLEILATARQEQIPTQINTTLTPRNIGQIDRLAELLAGQGIVMWSVFFLVPLGRARDASRLSAEQCEAAFARLWRQSKRHAYAIKTTEAPHYRRFLIEQRASEGRPPVGSARAEYASRNVNDGKGVMFIGHAGAIQPSGFLPLDCGIFPRDHVVRVYQDSPVFRRLRDANRLEGKCGRCEFRHVCGGSRARAFAVTGNPIAEEPDCLYAPSGGGDNAERIE